MRRTDFIAYFWIALLVAATLVWAGQRLGVIHPDSRLESRR